MEKTTLAIGLVVMACFVFVVVGKILEELRIENDEPNEEWTNNETCKWIENEELLWITTICSIWALWVNETSATRKLWANAMIKMCSSFFLLLPFCMKNQTFNYFFWMDTMCTVHSAPYMSCMHPFVLMNSSVQMCCLTLNRDVILKMTTQNEKRATVQRGFLETETKICFHLKCFSTRGYYYYNFQPNNKRKILFLFAISKCIFYQRYSYAERDNVVSGVRYGIRIFIQEDWRSSFKSIGKLKWNVQGFISSLLGRPSQLQIAHGY